MTTVMRFPSYPYQVADAATAVYRFFTENVQVSDPNMSNENCTDLMQERVCKHIASAVQDRLYLFLKNKPYGVMEEIEFIFEMNSEHSTKAILISPDPIVEDIGYRFHEATVNLKRPSYDLAAVTKGTYVLRVSPRLVTFAGIVIWSNPA